jgi:alpha,alpha-trehalase
MAITTQSLVSEVNRYIEERWRLCVRNQQEDEDTLLGLPFPYTVPSVEGAFQELYYWDTFFTTIGLAESGHYDLVRSNTDNLLYMVDKYGFVPNGNRTFYLNRSQPPFLSTMVRMIFEQEGNKQWLANAYRLLVREYDFWMKERLTPVGLNRHWQNAETVDLLGIYRGVTGRLKIDPAFTPPERRELQGAHFMAECEAGCDFTPRFEMRCGDFVPADLNSNLYVYEKDLAYFSDILGNGQRAGWEACAEQRRALMTEYCWQPNAGIFTDYDYKHARPGRILSVATLYPLWAGLATPEQARRVVENLHLLEQPFGIATCQEGGRNVIYQWDYPNGWAPLQYIAIQGLLNYGYREEAMRIAEKYVQIVCRCFEATGNLWEKYNVVDGSTNVGSEYDMPTLMGWTAGIFVWAVKLLTTY